MALSQDFGTGSLALREVFVTRVSTVAAGIESGCYDHRRTRFRARRIVWMMRAGFVRLLLCGMPRDGTWSPASALRQTTRCAPVCRRNRTR